MANNNKIPQELLEKTMKCETPEELLRLAKENGVALTKDEAEAYLAEGGTVDLSDEDMAKVAGGRVGGLCTDHCQMVRKGTPRK